MRKWFYLCVFYWIKMKEILHVGIQEHFKSCVNVYGT